MTVPPQPQAVLATITGKDLLDKLDGLTTALQTLALTIDPLPKVVADHETLIRDLVSNVTVIRTQLKAAWAGIGLLIAALAVLAGFLANMHH